MAKPVIIVTGKDGQLGYELLTWSDAYKASDHSKSHLSIATEFDFIFTGRSELDLTNLQQIQTFILQHKPAYFINCAAYTLVDKAETERELCYAINTLAVQAIAAACKQVNCQFIHISTDYVFDGSKQHPYLPNDATNPINYYGETKLQGELLALKENAETIVIRTSWVYSSHGKNFVKTMLRLMNEREEISVVHDQIGCPTYAADLASAILQIIIQLKNKAVFNPGGVYHYSNTGNISWFQFADAIKTFANKNCLVKPIVSSAYPTPAKRSHYSVMDTTDIEKKFNIEIKNWEESLKICISKLNTKD